MAMKKRAGARRGRPPGTTEQGEASRRLLYETAVRLISARGYEATTLRDIASEAGVSPGLLYRYFPNKRAVVLALYDELSQAYGHRAEALPEGAWPTRFLAALRTSLAVLAPKREALRALSGVLVGAGSEGLFAESTSFSRRRVQAVFARVVDGSTNPPDPTTARALGRLLYLAHLGALLFWLLDASESQSATDELLDVAELVSTWLPVLLATDAAATLVVTLDEIVALALFGEAES